MMAQNFIPLSAALSVPVVSSHALVNNFSSSLERSGEMAHINYLHDNASALGIYAVNNATGANATDSSIITPWTTLSPAGFHGLHCEKGSLTNGFGVTIQFILGITAFSSLIGKFKNTHAKHGRLTRVHIVVYNCVASRKCVGFLCFFS